MLDNLTVRETQFVELLCEGHTNESIANQLGISLDSVRKYSINVHRKFGVNTRLEVAVLVYKDRAKRAVENTDMIDFMREINELYTKRFARRT